jgi:hypothetical protein
MTVTVVRRQLRPRAEEGRPGDAPTSSLRVTDRRPVLGRFKRPSAGDPGRCGNQMSANRDPRDRQNLSSPGVGALWRVAAHGQRPFPVPTGRRA